MLVQLLCCNKYRCTLHISYLLIFIVPYMFKMFYYACEAGEHSPIQEDQLNDSISANEEEGSKNGRFTVRCNPDKSPGVYRNLFPKMQQTHVSLLEGTPFYHFFMLPKMTRKSYIVKKITECFNTDLRCFKLHGCSTSFTPRDVSLILGLHIPQMIFFSLSTILCAIEV